MNQLLFVNLERQRSMLRHGSAYDTARMLISTFFLLESLGIILVAVWIFFVTDTNSTKEIAATVAQMSVKVTIAILALAAVSINFVLWSVIQAFFDMADAALASIPEVKS